MLGALLRILGLLTAVGGLWNLVSVISNLRDESEFAVLAEAAAGFGVLMSWMVVVSGLTLFGVGEVLARFPKIDPKLVYADHDKRVYADRDS